MEAKLKIYINDCYCDSLDIELKNTRDLITNKENCYFIENCISREKKVNGMCNIIKSTKQKEILNSNYNYFITMTVMSSF